MGLFFVYILKASVCLALFYLFYRLLLSRDTFHRFNRIALLSILLLSLLIPLIEVTTTEQTGIRQTMLTLEQLLLMADGTPVAITTTGGGTLSWIQITLLLYLGGILFFACRHLYSLTRLLLLLRSGRCEKMERGILLIIHGRKIAPFSWMKYIVIAEEDLKENGREILIHERAHSCNRHSIDLLVADICIFFQWFNPASWLLKQELQNIHEYEADETVIKEGVDAKEYQLLLIKKAVGTRLYSMANSFNHSKLKKRITMMLKEKSSPWARLKYLYVLPLAAIAVTAFARPEVSNKVSEISVVKVNDLAAIVETKVQETVAKAVNDTVKLRYRSSAVSDGVDKSPQHAGGTKAGTDFEGNLKDSDAKTARPLLIIDGKEASEKLFAAINPERIKSISVLKGESAIATYGDRGKNGAILVVLNTEEEYQNRDTKKSDKAVPKGEQKVVGKVQSSDGKPVVGASVVIKGTTTGTIVDADGAFVLTSPQDAILQISYIGMKTIEIKASSKPFTAILEEK